MNMPHSRSANTLRDGTHTVKLKNGAWHCVHVGTVRAPERESVLI